MKPILNYLVGFLFIFCGGYVSYWSILAWKDSGFALDVVSKMKDGNGLFFIILIGFALVAIGFDKIMKQRFYSTYIKDKDGETKR